MRIKQFATLISTLLFTCLVHAASYSVDIIRLFSAKTATGYSSIIQPKSLNKTFQAYGTTTAGSGASVIKIWGSNVVSPASGTDVDWVLLGTITLTLGTTQTTDGFASAAAWRHIKAEVDSISGTNASVNVTIGTQSSN